MMTKNIYICVDCIKSLTGKVPGDLSVNDFKAICSKYSFSNCKCPKCGSNNIQKIFGFGVSYIKGYGFADKKGVKRDMDMHVMATNRDPYSSHRKMGEKRDVIRKLQKDKEHNSNSKDVYMN